MARSVGIRVDATSQTGTGHFMRCLALADALAARGGHVRFVSRALPASLEAIAREKGHALVQLGPAKTPANDDLAHSRWLETGRDEDAEATRAALDGVEWDWLVVDHYGIDARWEKQLREKVNKILVIYDIADREHDCDVLVDQNLHPEPERRYSCLVPAHAALLVGPRYALLRPEFSRARQGVGPRSGQVNRILVFFGGMDVADWTSAGLDALTKVARPGTHVDVVIGTQHPRRAAIVKRCADSGYRCHVQTTEMASLMAAADLGLGAGGSTTWERCCVGLPALAISVAYNQVALSQGLARTGGCIHLRADEAGPAALAQALQRLSRSPETVRQVSVMAYSLVDGLGTARVTENML
jgi:UDP-2,4-diacetamido-2,4,6-trideoxy-beta-L-altropyranose hydrolase